jgi:hypothetical protein
MVILFYTHICTSLPHARSGKSNKDGEIKVVENPPESAFSAWLPEQLTLQGKRNGRCGAIGWQISGEVGQTDGAVALFLFGRSRKERIGPPMNADELR